MAKRKQKQPPLTAKRRKWAEQRDDGKDPIVFKSQRLAHNIAIREAYERELTKLINRMTREADREIRALFESAEAKEYFAQDASISSQARILTNQLRKKFELSFAQSSGEIVERIGKRIDRFSESSLRSTIKKLSGGLSVKTDFITGSVEEALKASVSRNVNLIKSIPSEYFDQVEDLVMRSILPGGRGLEDLVALDKIKDKTVNRGVNIAKDQTRKMYNDLNAVRMEKAGLNQFIWRHSGGGKDPRDYHKNVLDGNIYSLDDPPLIDPKTGTHGIPGQLINCKCTMEPVITFGEEDE